MAPEVRRLGVVGGIGPESTLDYYRRLVDGWHERRGSRSHPRVLVDSLDGGPLIGPMVAGDLGPIREAVGASVERLAAGGAGLVILASVAGHSVYAEVADRAPIPMLSIVEATCRAAVRAGIRRPALFGTKVAVEGTYFASPFKVAGIDLVRPALPDREWIHDAYLGELVNGRFLDATRQRMLDILAALRDGTGVDGLILGGTELSVLLPEPAYLGLPILNAAAIHVAEALDWLSAEASWPRRSRAVAAERRGLVRSSSSVGARRRRRPTR